MRDHSPTNILQSLVWNSQRSIIKFEEFIDKIYKIVAVYPQNCGIYALGYTQ